MATEVGDPPKKKLNELKVTDLKNELESRGLEKTGVKAVLFERLKKALTDGGHDPEEFLFDATASTPGEVMNTSGRQRGRPSLRAKEKEAESEKEAEDGGRVKKNKHDETEEKEEEDAPNQREGKQERKRVDSRSEADGDYDEDTLDSFDAGGADFNEFESMQLQIVDESLGSNDEELMEEHGIGELDEEMASELTSLQSSLNGIFNESTAFQIESEKDSITNSDRKERTGDDSREEERQEAKLAAVEMKEETKGTAAAAAAAPGSEAGEENSARGRRGSSKGDQDAAAANNSNDEGVSLVLHVDDEMDQDLFGATSRSKSESRSEADAQDADEARAKAGEEKHHRVAKPGAGASSSDHSGDKEERSGTKESHSDMGKGDKSKSLSKSTNNKGDKVEKAKAESFSLWISGLSKETRAADLKAVISKYGKVTGAKVVTNAKSPGARCYGYVTVSSAEEVDNCIEHISKTELHGCVISVEKAKGEPGRNSSAPAPAKGAGDRPRTDKTLSSGSGEKKEVKPSSGDKKDDRLKRDAVKLSTKAAELRREGHASRDKSRDSKRSKVDNLSRVVVIDKDKGEPVVSVSTRSTDSTEKPEDGKEDEQKNIRSSSKSTERSRKRTRSKSAEGKQPRSESQERYDRMRKLKARMQVDRDRLEKERRLRYDMARHQRDRQLLERDRFKAMELERQNRIDAMRLASEREQLRVERERLQRERLELDRQIRIENEKRERERMEQEIAEKRRILEQLRMQTQVQSQSSIHPTDDRRSLKRPVEGHRGDNQYWAGGETKRPAFEQQRYEDRPSSERRRSPVRRERDARFGGDVQPPPQPPSSSSSIGGRGRPPMMPPPQPQPSREPRRTVEYQERTTHDHHGDNAWKGERRHEGEDRRYSSRERPQHGERWPPSNNDHSSSMTGSWSSGSVMPSRSNDRYVPVGGSSSMSSSGEKRAVSVAGMNTSSYGVHHGGHGAPATHNQPPASSSMMLNFTNPVARPQEQRFNAYQMTNQLATGRRY